MARKTEARIKLTVDCIEIEGTTIPVKGKWDGTYFSQTQFEGIHLNFESNTAATKFVKKLKKGEIVIHGRIERLPGNKGSWNMTVKEE